MHSHESPHRGKVSTKDPSPATPLDSPKPFACTYEHCITSFYSKGQLKDHKYYTHPYYCKRCDLDFHTFADSLAHKVEAMLPWLVGDLKNAKQKMFRHIVCEFCGEEFKSLGGRKLHQARHHQAPQRIVCQGAARVWDAKEAEYVDKVCGMVFDLPSAYISHIEYGECRFIKGKQLAEERQHKKVVKEMLNDTERFTANLQGNEYWIDPRETETLREYFKNRHDSGGVKIDNVMDSGESAPACAIASLKPDNVPAVPLNLMDDDTAEDLKERLDRGNPIERSIFEHHPEIGIRPPKAPDSHAPSDYGFAACDTRHGSVSGIASPFDTQSGVSINTPSGSTDASTNSIYGDVNYKALIPDNKNSPLVQRNSKAIEAAEERSRREDNKKNLFNTHFWDPYHKDYDPTAFISSRGNIKGKYVCPWPECQSVQETPGDIASHLRSYHSTPNTCKLCYRKFKDITALLQHFEASARGGKCGIAKTPQYPDILHEATGGFLSATALPGEKIWGVKMPGTENEAVDETGLPVLDSSIGGVKSHEYRAELPLRASEPVW